MIEIESYFLQLSISTINSNCTQCNTLGIASDPNLAIRIVFAPTCSLSYLNVGPTNNKYYEIRVFGALRFRVSPIALQSFTFIFKCLYKSIVLRTGSDQELGPWKLGTRMKIVFLSIKNRTYVAILWTPKTEVGPYKPVARTMRSNPLAIFFFFFIKTT